MDEELHILENELRRLRPRAPSPSLEARLEARLVPQSERRAYRSATSWTSWKWASWSAAAAAALIAAFVLVRPSSTTAPQGAAQPGTEIAAATPTAQSQASAQSKEYRPVAAQNILLESRDEGVVTLEDGTPARRVRDRYLDTVTWKNPRTNASLRWSVPREDVRVVPVLFQ